MKTFVLLISILYTEIVFSQDVIKKKNGNIIHGDVKLVSLNEIEFQVVDFTDTSNFSIPISELEYIKFKDGSIKYFNTEIYNEDSNKIEKKVESNRIAQTQIVDSSVNVTNRNKYHQITQVKNKEARKEITPILLCYSQSYYNQSIIEGFNNSTFSEGQFNINFISNGLIKTEDQVDPEHDDWVEKTLLLNKIPNQVIDVLFNDGQGNWTFDKLFEKARYNLNDLEVESLKATLGGVNAGIKKAKPIEDILGQLYIVTYRFTNIMTMNEYYDLQDQQNYETAAKYGTKYTPTKRNKKGYNAKRLTNFYQIILDPSSLEHIYSVLFLNTEARDSMVYNLKLIHSFNNSVFATEPDPLPKYYAAKTKNDFFNELASGNLTQFESALPDFFAVNSVIYSSDPLTIKIGKKEGLKIDQRYFVYETQVEEGKLVEKRVAVIRAGRKISDNRYNATGKTPPSYFYKVAGMVPIDKGMTIKRKYDKGISVYLTTGLKNENYQNYFNLRASLNISRIIKISQLRLEAGYSYSYVSTFDQNYPYPGKIYINKFGDYVEPYSNEISNNEIALGFRKDFYLAPQIQLSPYLGYQLGLMEYLDSNLNSMAVNTLDISTDDPYNAKISYSGFALGTDLGINLAHNFKLILSLNYMPKRYFDINPKMRYLDSRGAPTIPGKSSEPYYNKFDAKLLTNVGFRLDF